MPTEKRKKKNDQTPYYAAFSHMLGIGPIGFKKLLNIFKTPEKAYTAHHKDLENALGKKVADKFILFRTTFRADSIVGDLFKKDIQVITQESSDYPEQLVHIPDSPICLYLKGNKNVFNEFKDTMFAIVGSRKATMYGIDVAHTFAQGLSEYGFCIVSGMAAGIDTSAHNATLSVGGITIAVLGCGVDIIYPPQNIELYHNIIKYNGAIISEFPPGMTTLPGFFVSRNRIISGLSKGVLIVEGTAKSGTLITAKHAAEQGKDVFAPPSPLNSLSSQAPNLLIKQGAHIVFSPEDIAEEYNIRTTVTEKKLLTEGLDRDAEETAKLLLKEVLTPDQLTQKLNKDITIILAILTGLELAGIVAKNDQGAYHVLKQ